jgi:DNA-binding IclR family transcriptional regulator
MNIRHSEGEPRITAGASSSRKVLQILLAFSEHRREATVADLAMIIGAPVPTTYRHVALLKELQLLEEGRAGNYHPTAKVMPLARAAQLSNDLAMISKPIIAATAAQLRETVMLMQYFGEAVVCVERHECDRPMRLTFEQGHSVPLGVGASGKMVLACLPRKVQRARLAELAFPPGLEQELEQAARMQCATSLAEMDEGVWACSVPVLEGGSRPVVLTAAGPAARLSAASRDAALEAIRKSALLIREKYEKYAF